MKIHGVIVSRDGDLVKVNDKKSGSIRDVRITGTTQIRNDQKMGIKALIPGLSVKVMGMAYAEGAMEAKKIRLYPNAFAIAVTQQQQILENQAATSHAQASADEGLSKAGAAQSSADQAQTTANQGLSTAQSATTLATANTVAVGALNQRISNLGDYNTVASVAVSFGEGSSRLSKSSQSQLDEFLTANSNVNGYVVEIEGYTSSTGSRRVNQTLSDRRAVAVAQYLRKKDNVPAWRFLTPAGYGETHPVAANTNAKGRAQNRRVEVKVLVSKGIQQNPAVTTAAVQ
jgi:outer membrane protein OmpA-like peptidoglycan-associated protein